MLAKLSVKKPLTIFVSVIMILVLGVVSFMKMTPDLLPNLDLPYAVIITPYVGQTPETVESTMKMTPDLLPNLDLPYAVIITPYVGQTPETVESTVTKPLESAVSVVDGVKQITSNSADNYSMILIEFEDGTNMDTATIDVRSRLDTISDNWDDAVGSPYMIKAESQHPARSNGGGGL